jgi:hypothetical protein
MTYIPPPGYRAGLEFTQPYTPPPGYRVGLEFAPDLPSNELRVTFQCGEAVNSSLVSPLVEMSLALHQGESVGHTKYAKKDTRLHDAGVIFPWSMGEAFAASSSVEWPPGYSLYSSYRHFYELGFGVDLTTVVWVPLISAEPTLVDIFGSGHEPVNVWPNSVETLTWAEGESVAVGLATSYNIPSAFHAGEMLRAAVLNDRRLQLNLGSGEALAVDIDIASVASDLSVGESFEASLQIRLNLLPQSYVGEALAVGLTTTAAIQPVFYSGESAVVGLGTRPGAELSAPFFDGQVQSAPLWTRVVIPITFSDGQAVSYGLDMPYRADLSVSFATDSHVSLDTIQTSIALGSFTFTEGASFRVTGEMGELSNYKAATGEAVRFELFVEPGFVVTFCDGADLEATGNVRPAENLSIELWGGETFYSPVLDVLISAHLQAYFYDGVFITPTEETSTVVFDLASPPAYVDTLDWWRELNQFEIAEPLASRGWGAGTDVLVTVSLETRPRFSISFTDGQSWALESNALFLDATLSFGFMPAWGRSESFYVEPTVNLCYPNVFPSADDMEVELDFTEESCYADFMFTGESVRYDLSCVYDVSPRPLPVGEHLDCMLTVYDLWRVTVWVGEHLDCYLATDMNIRVRATTGESLRVTMEEPSVLIGDGATLVATLTNTFDVEFLERGCLDNEYKYIDENGDEDKEKFNPVAVELEPFLHNIQARCF